MPVASFDLTQKLFFWSNALYVLGALLTCASAALIVYERRTRAAPSRLPRPVLKDSVILAPALGCLLATVTAIYFSRMLLHRQGTPLETLRLRPASGLSQTDRPTETYRPAERRDMPATKTGGSPSEASDTAEEPVAFQPPPAELQPMRELDISPLAAQPLRRFEGTRAVVSSTPTDGEAPQLASHLLLLLIANGIDARQDKDGSGTPQLAGEPGIHIRYRGPDRGHDLAAVLAGLLRARGLHVDVAPAPDSAGRPEDRNRKSVSHDDILVSVGPKS